MANHTSEKLRELFIYQVYVRNHTEEGTFKALCEDLDRIKALGVDVVYLLPIHEIGEVKRKGSLGSPYAIKDYYSINHELGTLEDFKQLIKEVHHRDMKLMMDIVFNHTSPDSVLIHEHPEFFFINQEGTFGNRVGDWWDIKDFDYTKDYHLHAYLIEVLRYWTNLGVDGYRFDVASFLPLDFLHKAHQAVREIDPDTIWLTESVHGHFLREFRNLGYQAISEGELYQVFDMAYDYDVHPAFEAYLKKEGTLEAYIDAILFQECIYPQNYVKMRNLENHDFGRIAGYVNHLNQLKNWHALSFFLKGSTMIFSGGEYSASKHPSLFDKDTILREGEDLSGLIKTCAALVKSDLYSSGVFDLKIDNDVVIGTYERNHEKAVGIFNVSGSEGTIKVPLEDGVYTNRMDQSLITIINKSMTITSSPVWLVKS